MASRRLEVEIIGDASSLNRAMGSAGKSTESFGGKMKRMGKVAGVAAGAAAVGGAVVAIKSVIGAAMDAEKAQFRLTQAFKSQNVSAKDQKKAMEAVNRVSKQAALDDEDLSDVLANMTRATGDVEKATKGMALAAEIARGRNVSLAVAAKAVEKTMLGSDTALKRLGVSVPRVDNAYMALKLQAQGLEASLAGATAAEQEAIKAKIDTIKESYGAARAQDKQASSMKTLEVATQKFAGSSKEFGETAAGSQERLAVAFENLQERIGKHLLPVFTKLMEALLRLTLWAEKNWPQFEKAIKDGIQTAKKVWDDFGPVIEAVAKQIENIVKLVVALFKGDWSEAWEKFKDVIAGALKLGLVILGEYVEKVRAVAEKIGSALKAGIAAGIKGIANLIVGAIIGAINAAIRLINKFKIPSVDPLGKFGPTIPGWGGFNIPEIPVPEFAQGGIVTKPTLALIGERGPEAVVPLSRGGGAMGSTFVFNFPNYVGDRRELELAMQDAAQKFLRRNARSLIPGTA